MANLTPSATIAETDSALVITLPVKPNYLVIGLLLIFLAIAGFAVTQISPDFLLARSRSISWFGLLIAGGFGLVLLAIELIWQLVGRETLEITAAGVVLRNSLWVFPITRRLRVDEVRRVFIPRKRLRWLLQPSLGTWSGFRRGMIGLSASRPEMGRVQTVYFGGTLPVGEAKALVALIRQRFPQYRD